MISGSVKAGGRRERSRQALVSKLMAAVEALLSDGASYTDLSVDEILARTDVPRSTFYYHFRDKGELLIAVSADATAQIVAVSEGLYRDGLHRSRRDFTAAVQETARAWLAHEPLMSALAEMAAYNPAVKEQFLAGWQAARQRVADHIVAGQAAGFVRPDLHPDHVAGWLTWMAERGIAMLAWPASGDRVHEVVDGLATAVWHTLYPDSPDSPDQPDSPDSPDQEETRR
ncbi:MAG TPA: TetR/AcrR family transcriptional regulator [Pseudonocardia sp.]|nr:TetR/AcrR family transcriptional regulator [Pseudonocardia sp.]